MVTFKIKKCLRFLTSKYAFRLERIYNNNMKRAFLSFQHFFVGIRDQRDKKGSQNLNKMISRLSYINFFTLPALNLRILTLLFSESKLVNFRPMRFSGLKIMNVSLSDSISNFENFYSFLNMKKYKNKSTRPRF